MDSKFDGMPQLREPAEETTDYRGFIVCDDRCGGSITAGKSRLPLWCLIADLVAGGFAELLKQREGQLNGLTAKDLSGFLYNLLEQRGDFARLLCVLADVERAQSDAEEKTRNPHTPAWWQIPEQRQRVREALQACLDATAE